MCRRDIMHHLPPYMLGYIAIFLKDYHKTNLGLLHYLTLNSLATFLHLSPFWRDCRFLTAFSSQPYFVLCSLWLISHIIEKTNRKTYINYTYIYFFLRNSFSHILLNFLPIEETPHSLLRHCIFMHDVIRTCLIPGLPPLLSLSLSHMSHDRISLCFCLSLRLPPFQSISVSVCLVLFIRWLMSHRSLSLSLGKVTGRHALIQCR